MTIYYGSGTGTEITGLPIPYVGTPSNPSAGLLSLEEWRNLIHYQPWHFWGMSNSLVPVSSKCSTVVQKYAWQGADAAGREDIINAIIAAEERLTPLLGYSPAPHYREFILQWPRYEAGTNIYWMGYAGSDQRWINLKLPEGHVRAVGVETLDELEMSAAVVFTDTDGDGLEDTFTVSVSLLSVVDASEIAIYFAALDRLDGEGPIDKWRVRPVSVTVDALNMTATIRGKKWLLVDPVLYEGVSSGTIDPSAVASFVTTVDVYRRYTSSSDTYATAQAVLIWETPPYPNWLICYPCNTSDPAAIGYTMARVGIRNAEQGIVTVGESVYDSLTQTWSAVPWYSNYRFRPPDRVVIHALCGVAMQNGNRVNDRMARIVSRLAAAELSRRICACDQAMRELYHWQFDLARSSGANDEAYSHISQNDLSNPLGTRRGQVFAWNEIKTNRIIRGFVP